MSLRRRMAEIMVRAAAARLSRRHPEWAEALRREQAHLSNCGDEVAWAFGSLRAALALEDAYPWALALAVAAMTLHQWRQDEGPLTLLVMVALCGLLGALRPSRFVVSGLAIGAVVAAVNAFETLTGVRPAYETYGHTWAHDLRWLWLVAPALLSSAAGRHAASFAPE